MSAVYTVYTSPNHETGPDLLPTLIVTPHGSPETILYTYLHTVANRCQYLLTPSPDGDLCVAKMYPPSSYGLRATSSVSSINSARSAESINNIRSGSIPTIRCEASRNCKFFVTNAGINQPLYKVLLPNPDSPDDPDPAHGQPLFQISKTNPRATFLSMWYYKYAGHGVPPQRVLFGKVQRNASPANNGTNSAAVGGTRIAITGATRDEKAVWQTLGEGNEDMVEWIILCSALAVMDEEIIKATGMQNIGLARQEQDLDQEQTPRMRMQSSGSYDGRDRNGPIGQQYRVTSGVPNGVRGNDPRHGTQSPASAQRFSRDKSSPAQRKREDEYERDERVDRNIRRSRMAGGVPSAYRASPPPQNGGPPNRNGVPAERRPDQRPVAHHTNSEPLPNRQQNKRQTGVPAPAQRPNGSQQPQSGGGLWSKLKGGSKPSTSSPMAPRSRADDQRVSSQSSSRLPTQQMAAMRISSER